MSKKDESVQKIGEGHAAAMLRLGLKELRGSLYPESNVAQPSEYGLYGTKTPGEVAESRRSLEPALEEEKGSVVADRLRQAESRDDHGKDNRELEK